MTIPDSNKELEPKIEITKIENEWLACVYGVARVFEVRQFIDNELVSVGMEMQGQSGLCLCRMLDLSFEPSPSSATKKALMDNMYYELRTREGKV